MRTNAKKVPVHTLRPYDVVIGNSVYRRVADYIPKNTGTVAIVCDANVSSLYLGKVVEAVKAAGVRTCSYILSGGENGKNLDTIAKILAFLEENSLARSDIIIALGGGITGDIAGFAAAIYLRGIGFIQMPTTLLAAVDSSVGGKTGVNTAGGKNLIGAIWQPLAVICDCDFLSSLPQSVFSDGMAEVIKYGVIAEPELLSPKLELAQIIEMCVGIKARIVQADEREEGERKLLNFGHTVGHAIEKCSDYEVSHGHAVATGMVIASDIAKMLGVSEYDCKPEIIKALEAWKLPVSTSLSSDDLFDAILSDKKREKANITLVLPKKIGECELKSVELGGLRDILKSVMEAAK